MTSAQLNYLNIGLMLVACIVAFIIPFEMFLFSYAILGPLHYLTEISWLHKRQYFTPNKKDYILLASITVIISLPNVVPFLYNKFGPRDINGNIIYTQDIIDLFTKSGAALPSLIFVSFAGAALLLITSDTAKRLTGFALISVIAYLVHAEKFMMVIFTVFLPTLVHVFVFTGAFILLGALRTKSASGILSLVIFVACAASLFLLLPDRITPPSPSAMRRYDEGFLIYNQQVLDFFLDKRISRDMVYFSSFGVKMSRFIAFAYTYHYLNWFSKTSVIKWHKVPVRSLVIVVVIWLLSVALYFIDYISGIMALYFLSFLHVICEFPLNFRSFREIGMELRQQVVGEKA